MNIKLRPHHLFCTQGYSGKGYSDEYVKNMTEITNYLRTESGAKVTITFGADDLCKFCPSLTKDNACKSLNHVNHLDNGVKDLLSLEEKEYSYQDLLHQIHSKITEATFDSICKDCSWYPISACKKNILSGKYLI